MTEDEIRADERKRIVAMLRATGYGDPVCNREMAEMIEDGSLDLESLAAQRQCKCEAPFVAGADDAGRCPACLHMFHGTNGSRCEAERYD